MIGKIPKPGKSFGGCVNYNVLKKDAAILFADGVRTDQIEQTIRDFNMQRKMNPELGQAVGHIALSWSLNDLEKLNDQIMVEIAHAYLEKMKIQDTQVLMVRHHDKRHPHLHLVYNRVNNQGKTISDRFQRQNNIKVCKELTLKYGFYMAPGKENVNRRQLKGEDKVKYELFDAIKSASKQLKSMDELIRVLRRHGIDTQYKFKSGTKEVQGVSFCKDGYKFKGSEIDRSLSYGKLSQEITDRTKAQQEQQQYEQEQKQQWQQDQREHPLRPKGELRSLADQLREALKESRDINSGVDPAIMQSDNYEPVGEGATVLKAVVTTGLSVLGEMMASMQSEPEVSGKKKKRYPEDKEEYRGPRR